MVTFLSKIASLLTELVLPISDSDINIKGATRNWKWAQW